MSDDEMPSADGMDGFDGMEGGDGIGGMEGTDDGGSDEDYSAAPELPDNIKKEIVTEAPAGAWKRPKSGDDVTVHCVSSLSDGSEVDSSRSRNEPFSFVLGQGQEVFHSSDQMVATMVPGEVAKFTVTPEVASNEDGPPTKIPKKATMFEVELLSFVSKEDLFKDGGAIKAEIKEGSGWKKPKLGDEVRVSMKVTANDGSDIEEKNCFECVLGSECFGPLSRTIDQALCGMKKGGEARLTCAKDYAYGDERPDGAIIHLTLEEIYETKDVSFEKNKTLMMKIIKEGEGYNTPKETAKVKLSVESATDGVAPIPGFTPKVLEFVVGNGEVCDALECAVAEMKKGERAVLTVPASTSEAQLGLRDFANSATLTFELLDFDTPKSTYSLSEQEKVDFAAARKDVGAGLFKSGRTQLALRCYSKITELLNSTDHFEEAELKAKARECKKLCELNKAACFLRLKEHVEAKKACEAVLKEERQNVKALYRRAQAECCLKNFQECIRDCKLVVELDTRNKDARALLKEALAGQKEEDRKSKGLFTNMCKALGKGPIREPGKSKEREESEEEDHEMEDVSESCEGSAAANAEVAAESGETPDIGIGSAGSAAANAEVAAESGETPDIGTGSAGSAAANAEVAAESGETPDVGTATA